MVPDGDEGDAMGVSAPLRVLLSAQALDAIGAPLQSLAAAHGVSITPVVAEQAPPQVDVDVAFVSRDVTSTSTKHEVLPHTQRFYDQMLNAGTLRWAHIHSAGADRPVYQQLHARGVIVTTSSGANALVVAHSVLAGVLMLAREMPTLMQAQRERAWRPLVAGVQPRDLPGQHAVVAGFGPVGRHVARLLDALGLRVSVLRRTGGTAVDESHTWPAHPYEHIDALLPQADWLVLACPLSDRTRSLLNARRMACMPRGARIVNVARGEVVDEAALIAALQSGHLGGAMLDVFAHEPLPADSPLWSLPNVIATPHTAGHSDGNAARVAQMFLDNLARWLRDEPLAQRIGSG